MGEGGSLYICHISLSILNQLPLEETCLWFFLTWATWYNSWHLMSSCFKILHVLLPHFMLLPFSLIFLSLWRPSFLLPPGQEGRAGSYSYWFSSALGSRQVHSSWLSACAANGMTKGKQREVEITHFLYQASHFQPALLFSLGPRGSVG